MVEIAAIADQDTILGLKLAGVRDGKVFSKDDIKVQIREYADAKILILTEEVAQYLRENNMMEKIHATTVAIPDKTGSSGAALEKISRLFEEAIGVKLKE